MSITMKEIAFLCDVSRGTVDRVLNNRGHVRKETAEKVRTVAVAMGYRTDIASYPFRENEKNFRIGMLINSEGHSYYSDILNSMLSTIKRFQKYGIIGIAKISSCFDIDQQLMLLEELQEEEIDALVITPANHPRIKERLQLLSKTGIPIVLVSSLLDDFVPFAFFGCDHYHSGLIATDVSRMLTAAGSSIAVLVGDYSMPGHMLRLKGFIEGLNHYGGYNVLEPVQSFDDDAIAYKTLSGFLTRHKKIDLIFLAAGGFAGCYNALRENGLLGKIKILAMDKTPENLEQLKNGNVSVILDQDPAGQGNAAIKLITDFAIAQVVPKEKKQYSFPAILVKSSIE